MNIAEVLRKAADYLDAHGWIQHATYAEPGKDGTAVDVSGAITMACRHEPNFLPLETATRSHLTKIINHKMKRGGLLMWNDMGSQTQEDVTAMLRKAADRWEDNRHGE